MATPKTIKTLTERDRLLMDAGLTRNHVRPVPGPVAFGEMFIDEDLPEAEYKEELKKVIREWLASPVDQQNESPLCWESYDHRTWDLIEEVLREN